MFLRDMNLAGMPFLTAVDGGGSDYMPMEASALLAGDYTRSQFSST